MFLVSCIPRYFILFVAIVNGSSFVGVFSWNACDFCVLILYPETLLKLLIVSGDLGLRRLGHLNIQSCHLQMETI